jgi:uncharacterized protein involved in exopolysaccharide biosynthesis
MDEEAEEASGGGSDPELLKSYVRFLRRAIRAHRRISAVVLVVGAALTVLAYKFLPRTYTCATVLMVETNQVLEGNYPPNALPAAESLILRHDNLEAIVHDTGLVKKFHARRPPLLALKDRLQKALIGELSEESEIAALVGTLESRVSIKTANSTLTVSVDWSDPRTAAEVADAARESFVRNRHVAEMSAFEEKLTILDGHATSLRDEIETLAKQARDMLAEREKNVRAARSASSAASAPATDTAAAVPRARPKVADGEDLEAPRLKEELDEKKKKLADYERDHDQRVQTERAKLDDLKLKLTPMHPEVAAEERRVAALEQEPSDIALLRADVASLQGELKQRDLLSRHGAGAGGGARGAGAPAAVPGLDPLPGDIVQLLDVSQLDPALAAQLSSAVSKYAALRDDIRTGRVQFDTAQAAFNFRYKVVVPAEAPKSPTKPKAAVLIGGGAALSLVIALLLPLLFELSTGLVIERWQVATTQIPVLADLRLPPAAGDRDVEPHSGTPG